MLAGMILLAVCNRPALVSHRTGRFAVHSDALNTLEIGV